MQESKTQRDGPTVKLDSRRQLEALRLAVQRELFGKEGFRLKDEHQQAFRRTLQEVNGLLNPFSYFLDNEQPAPQSRLSAQPDEQYEKAYNKGIEQGYENGYSDAEQQGGKFDGQEAARQYIAEREQEKQARRTLTKAQRERKQELQKARRRKQAAEKDIRKRTTRRGAAHAGESPYVVSHLGPNGRRQTVPHELGMSITQSDVADYMVQWFELHNELPTKTDWNPYSDKRYRNEDRVRRFEQSGGRQKWPTPDTLNQLKIDWHKALDAATKQIAGEEQS